MSIPKWMNKKETPRDFSQKREKKFAKKFGAKTTPNSGARWHSKGDLTTETHLIELKSTTKNQMVLHKAVLEKIRSEALKEGKIPVVVVDFGNIILTGIVET